MAPVEGHGHRTIRPATEAGRAAVHGFCGKFRQAAVNMEIGGLLAGVERLPPSGGVRFGIDCQMVVSGFGKRLLIADDDRSFHSGTWRLINDAMSLAPAVGVEIFKIKAHRSREQVRPDAWGFAG